MKRTLFVAAVVLGFATTASAATLSIAADAASYNVGDTITLTMTGTSTTEVASGVYARITYEAALTETVGSSQTPQTTSFGNSDWTQGSLGAPSDGAITLLNQIFIGGSVNGAGVTTSTATLVAQAAGTVNVAYVIGGPSALSYFGITNSAGTSFVINAIPEPTVASLIGLGLVGLAVGGRRRSS